MQTYVDKLVIAQHLRESALWDVAPQMDGVEFHGAIEHVRGVFDLEHRARVPLGLRPTVANALNA